MSTRVLVTGAAGFIGGPAVEALRRRGFEVHALSSRQSSIGEDGVVWHTANLLDPSDTAPVLERVRPSHLLHLAWHVRPGAWAGAQGHLGWLRAGLSLIEQFADVGGTRVVMAGSCAEYDWHAGVCSESSTPLVPATFYGATKLALGNVLQAYARETRMSAAWARIFFTFGPREHPDRLVASVIRSVLAGEPAACTDGRQVRDFLYVDDVATALVALLESELNGPCNIASGEGVSVADLARRAGTLMGRPDLIELGARRTATDEPPLVVADVSRLKSLGWTPQYTLDAALDATIAWWREQPVPEVTLHE